MNVCSLTKNSDDFNILLNDLDFNFDILAITESCIGKDSSSPVNLHLDNYSIEQTPAETSALVSMKHKNNDTPSIIRNDEKYISDPITTANTFNNFSHQLLRLFSQKSSSQADPLEVFYHKKAITLLQ